MTVQLALIGAGLMGRSLADVVKAVAWGRITRVCDPSREQGLTVAQELSAAWCGEYRDVLADKTIQAVIIATPLPMHESMTLAALRAGKHVFCEKPMAATTQECDRMIRAARQAGRRLMIGHCLRFDPKFQLLLQSVRSGEIGVSQAIIAQDTTASWQYSGWRRDRRIHSGIIYEKGVHTIDLVCAVLGEPVSVTSVCTGLGKHGMERLVTLLIRFAGGRYANLIFGVEDPWAKRAFEVHGSKGSVRMLYSADEASVAVCKTGEKSASVRRANTNDILAEELHAFCRAIATDAEVPVPGKIGRQAVAVAQAAVASYSTGRSVWVKSVRKK